MRKALMCLAAAVLLMIAAAFWTVATAPVIIGGTAIVAMVPPGAYLLFYGALGLFAISLVLAIHATVRVLLRPAPTAETPAEPEEYAKAPH